MNCMSLWKGEREIICNVRVVIQSCAQKSLLILVKWGVEEASPKGRKKETIVHELEVSPHWVHFYLEKAAWGVYHAARAVRKVVSGQIPCPTVLLSDSSHKQNLRQVSLAGFSQSRGSIWQFVIQWGDISLPLIVYCVICRHPPPLFFLPTWFISSYFPLFCWQWKFPSINLREYKEKGMIPVQLWDKRWTLSLSLGHWWYCGPLLTAWEYLDRPKRSAVTCLQKTYLKRIKRHTDWKITLGGHHLFSLHQAEGAMPPKPSITHVPYSKGPHLTPLHYLNELWTVGHPGRPQSSLSICSFLLL